MGIYRGLNIVKDGLVFGYDADDRSSRFYPGEPTTNLATSVSPLWSAWGGMTGTSTSYISASGRMGVKLATFTSGGVEWWVDSGGWIRTVSPNTTYTISAKIRFSGGNPHQNLFYIRQYNSSNAQITEGGWYYSANNVSIGDGWYRTYRTFTTTSTTVSLYLHGYEYNAGISIEIEDIQFEQKSHATQFVSGTRSVTQGLIDLKKGLSIDLSNVSFDSTAHPTFDGTDGISISTTLGSRIDGQPLTVECVMKPGRLAGQYQDIIVNRGDAAWNWMLYQHYDDGAISFHAGNTQNKSTFIPTVGKWYHVVATVTGAGVCKLYINGSVVHQNNSYVYGTGQPNLLCIGKFGTSSEYYLGEIRVAKLYNKALSDTEVLQNYSAYKYRFNIE